MRAFALALLLALARSPTLASDISVAIQSARPFGYFVGDLIHARIDIRAAPDAVLSPASLPHPGHMSVSLDLREVDLEEMTENGQKLWRLNLTYQNFYVALDVREIAIPAFTVNITMPDGARAVEIPAWRIGVAPLREIVPEKKERAEDYLRPDGAPVLLSQARPKLVTAALAAATLFWLFLTARDRAWPPFHKRRARLFSALARHVAAMAREPTGAKTLRTALRDIHRALDVAYGKSFLEEDLPNFLGGHPHFAPLEVSFRRFFASSRKVFFGADPEAPGVDMTELSRFTAALSERERAG